MMKKFNQAKAKRSLDRILSAYILNKYNRTCMRCGKQGYCDTAHILPKEYLSLRWYEYNLICLCKRCHKFGNESFHKNPISTYEWLKSKFGIEYLNKLSELSKTPITFNQQSYEDIKQLYQQKPIQ